MVSPGARRSAARSSRSECRSSSAGGAGAAAPTPVYAALLPGDVIRVADELRVDQRDRLLAEAAVQAELPRPAGLLVEQPQEADDGLLVQQDHFAHVRLVVGVQRVLRELLGHAAGVPVALHVVP